MALKIALEASKQVLSFEKKKVILPALFCLVIFIGIVSGHVVRIEGYDDQIAHESLEMHTELQTLHAMNQSFGNITQKEMIDIQESEVKKREAILNKLPVKAASSLAFIYRSDLYPVAPAGTMFSQEDKSLLFSSSDGYVLSQSYVNSGLLTGYRAGKIRELTEKINSNDTSFEEFKEERDKIKAIEVSDPRVIEFYENGGIETGSPANVVGNMNYESAFHSQEVQWYHFTPALVVTFMLYYLINAIAVEFLRNTFYLVRGYRMKSDTITQ